MTTNEPVQIVLPVLPSITATTPPPPPRSSRKRPPDKSAPDLIAHLARTHNLPPERFVTMSPAELTALIAEENLDLVHAYTTKYRARIARSGRAFPARRGEGALTVAALRANLKRHLATQGLDLASIGWTPLKRKTRSKREQFLAPDCSVADMQKAIIRLGGAVPDAQATDLIQYI